MKILTSSQMQAVDKAAIEGLGITGLTLMENASIEVYRALSEHFADARSIIVVCGKGNNGGDGFAVARHVATRGGRVRVVLPATAAEIKGDALVNLRMARAAGINVLETPDVESWRRHWIGIDADLVVDAIFGTGLKSAASGLFGTAIEDINGSGRRVVSIDVPSGLSSDTGELLGPTVRATLTVALQCPKICHVFPPASEYCGEVVVAPIGIPPRLHEIPEHRLELLDAAAASILTPRRRDAHKGHFGHALVVAGSIGKTGAAIMSGMAALRAGAGLVTVATPRSCLPIVAAGAPEIMTEPLAETPNGTISSEAVRRIQELAAEKDVLVVGPGVTTDPSTVIAIREIIRTRRQPIVLDADGVNCFAGAQGLLQAAVGSPHIIATPHPGELARLLGISISDVLKDRVDMASRLAIELGLHVVLKGYRTLIATPSGQVFVNPTGNPGMATGGTGDVLTGLIGGLMAQSLPLPGVVNLGVYLHGLAGDLAARDVGEISLVATDLLKHLPAAFRECSGAR
ncbi:MAG: NAD(P)H-hydrate dehydratase [Acidobacteriota bacterium]